jgi:glutaredoxin 3
MAKVVVYSTATCPYCVRAKMLLDQKKVAYEEIWVDRDDQKREEMVTRSGRRTVPQIFINDQPIGGFDDLWALEQKGELDQLLK